RTPTPRSRRSRGAGRRDLDVLLASSSATGVMDSMNSSRVAFDAEASGAKGLFQRARQGRGRCIPAGVRPRFRSTAPPGESSRVPRVRGEPRSTGAWLPLDKFWILL